MDRNKATLIPFHFHHPIFSCPSGSSAAISINNIHGRIQKLVKGGGHGILQNRCGQ